MHFKNSILGMGARPITKFDGSTMISKENQREMASTYKLLSLRENYINSINDYHLYLFFDSVFVAECRHAGRFFLSKLSEL